MAINVVSARIVGVRPYSFEGKEGEEVRMNQIFFTYENSKTQGVACGQFNMSEKAFIREGVNINSPCKVMYFDKKWNYVSG